MKKFGLLIFIILNLKFLVIFAQTSTIDSLENVLQQYTDKDTIRINLLNNFAEATLQLNQEKSMKYAEEAFELANMLNFKKGKAESLKYIGIIYEKHGNYPLSLEYYQKALKINEETGNKQEIANCLKNIGIIYTRQGNYPMSLEYYQKALKIHTKISNKQGEANCLNNIGIIYQRQGNYPMSLEYYQKSLKINEEIGSMRLVTGCLINIGTIYNNQEDYTMALTYYEKALGIFKESGHTRGKASCLNNIGIIHVIQESYPLAHTYFQKALDINYETGDKNGIAMTLNNIGTTYQRQGNNPLALEHFQKALKINEEINNKFRIVNSYLNLGTFYIEMLDYKKALDYTNKGLTIATELELLNEQRNLHLQISGIYTATNNYKKALENYILYKELNDSIFNEKNIKKITGLEYQYEFEKEKQAIELEQQKKDAITAEKSKRQKILSIAFILGFILMTSLVIVILRSFFQKRKANNILTKQKLQIEAKNKVLTLQKEEIQNFAIELEKANKTKDKFFSIIAHDLKNPFNTLLGFSNVLLNNYTTIDEEKRETYIKFIYESSTKIYKLLENILTWAQSQRGKIKFTTETIDISALITETIALLEESAQNKEIKITLNAEKDLSINADKNMIDAVVRNLVSNAVKFTPKGGCITIKSQITTDKNKQKFAEISVKDSGVGIPHEIQSKLFKITENITTKGTEEETGTGLGLILCKEFIEKHNGKIWVESEVGNGCKFSFRIPFSS